MFARLDALTRGETTADLLAEMRSRYAVFGDDQSLPGCRMLLHRDRIEHLDDLPYPRRIEFLLDLFLLGEAVRAAPAAFGEGFRRVNHEVLGNTWPQPHGHVHARYHWEPEEYRYGPTWRYPAGQRPKPPPASRLAELRATITSHPQAAMRRGYAVG